MPTAKPTAGHSKNRKDLDEAIRRALNRPEFLNNEERRQWIAHVTLMAQAGHLIVGGDPGATVMTAREILRDARRLLVQYGWIQGTAGNKHIGFCAVGALSFVQRKSSCWDAFNDAWLRLFRVTRCSLMTWNDTPGLTLAEILVAFRKAEETDERLGE